MAAPISPDSQSQSDRSIYSSSLKDLSGDVSHRKLRHRTNVAECANRLARPARKGTASIYHMHGFIGIQALDLSMDTFLPTLFQFFSTL
jgi:hypothetical protein